MDLETSLALVNKPPIEEITHLNLVNKPPIDELYHHGILGMRWGIRRYQNPDGSLTPEGQRRLDKRITKKENKERKKREAILRDPEALAKNVDKFSPEEINRAMQNFEWQKSLRSIRDQKSEARWNKAMKTVQKAVDVGNVANAGITFLNSPAGKLLRSKLGYDTGDIGSFKTPDEIKKDQAAMKKLQYELNKAAYDQANSKLGYEEKQRSFEWAKEDRDVAKSEKEIANKRAEEDRANKMYDDSLKRRENYIKLQDLERRYARGESISGGGGNNQGYSDKDIQDYLSSGLSWDDWKKKNKK